MVKDNVHRRIVVEYGQRYAYVYMTDGNGKLVPDKEESFKQPYVIDRKDVADEANECFDLVWQHLDDTVNTINGGDLQDFADGLEDGE